MMVSNNVCNSCMFVQGESNPFPQRLICFLLKTSRLSWSQILILWIAMYCFSGAADSIICPYLLMLQPYISYLKYDFCFTRPSVVNIYSKRNWNYKSYQWNSCKKRREKRSWAQASRRSSRQEGRHRAERLGVRSKPSEAVSGTRPPEHTGTPYPHLPICFSIESVIFGSLLK